MNIIDSRISNPNEKNEYLELGMNLKCHYDFYLINDTSIVNPLELTIDGSIVFIKTKRNLFNGLQGVTRGMEENLLGMVIPQLSRPSWWKYKAKKEAKKEQERFRKFLMQKNIYNNTREQYAKCEYSC